MATGVLVVGVNRATRLLGHLQTTDKEYRATIRLGQSTVTDDHAGEIIATTDASRLQSAQIDAALAAWVGDVEQAPSRVSAIKVDGRRSYDRVRAGEDVTLPARPVTIWQFDRLNLTHTQGFCDIDVHVECSSGTYVRALARDVGHRLDVGGHLTALRRTRVGPFDLSAARDLTQLAAFFDVMDLSTTAAMAFAAVEVGTADSASVRHGRPIGAEKIPAGGATAIFDTDGQFLALYERRGDVGAPIAVFD